MCVCVCVRESVCDCVSVSVCVCVCVRVCILFLQVLFLCWLECLCYPSVISKNVLKKQTMPDFEELK